MVNVGLFTFTQIFQIILKYLLKYNLLKFKIHSNTMYKNSKIYEIHKHKWVLINLIILISNNFKNVNSSAYAIN